MCVCVGVCVCVCMCVCVSVPCAKMAKLTIQRLEGPIHAIGQVH